MINGNENEAKNEKKMTKLRHKQTQPQRWTQIYEIENVSQYNDGYMY